MALVEFQNNSAPYINAENLNKIQESNIYSTSEIEIGKWTDNKPIYRKVIVIQNPTFNNYVSHNIANIDTIINVNWMLKEGNDAFRTMPIAYQESGSVNARFSCSPYIFNKTNYLISAGSYFVENSSNISLRIIVEYTKTTD